MVTVVRLNPSLKGQDIFNTDCGLNNYEATNMACGRLTKLSSHLADFFTVLISLKTSLFSVLNIICIISTSCLKDFLFRIW